MGFNSGFKGLKIGWTGGLLLFAIYRMEKTIRKKTQTV